MNFSKVIFIACALVTVASCQRRSGPCPRIDSASPNPAEAATTIDIVGSDFTVGYDDLWGEAQATPPEVWLTIESSPMMPVDLGSMDFKLTAEMVVLESWKKLKVELPNIEWSSLESYLTDLPSLSDISECLDKCLDEESGCDQLEIDPAAMFNLLVCFKKGGMDMETIGAMLGFDTSGSEENTAGLDVCLGEAAFYPVCERDSQYTM